MADLDIEALKTLQNIEKLLKGVTATMADRPTFSSKTSAKDKSDKEARKAFRAVAATTKDTNDALLGLNKNLITLNGEVGAAAKGFGALNTQMAKFMSSLTPIQQQDQTTPPVDLISNGFNATNKTLASGFNGVIKTITTTSSAIVAAIGAKAAQPAGGNFFTNFFGRGNRQPGSTHTVSPQTTVPPTKALGKLSSTLGTTATQGGLVTVVFNSLVDASIHLAKDFYAIARVGMGSAENLKDLSLEAFKSGMSLREYTKMIGESTTAVARAGSLDNYYKIISAQDDQLAAMGIFGDQARTLQASLAQSNTMAGIAIGDLTKASAQQVDVFDKLRKASNMTAEEFGAVVKSVSQNENAQRELLGLHPRERMARMNELIQLQTLGTKFGLTADASAKLGESLIKARNATVKDRFDSSAALLQAAAFTGNGALGQRAMELNMKGRRRTSDEDQEFAAIIQQIDRSSQGMYEQGSLGTQAVLDTLDENLGKGAVGEIVKNSRGLSLAQDAGKVNQEAFGKHVGAFGQAVGKLNVWVDGFRSSFLAPIGAALGTAVTYAFRGPILEGIGSAIGKGAGAGSKIVDGAASMMSKLTAPLEAIKNAGSSLFGWLTRIPQALGAAGSKIVDFAVWLPEATRKAMNALKVANMIDGPISLMKNLFAEAGGVFTNGAKAAGSAIANGAKTIGSGLFNVTKMFGPAAGYFAAAIELFTGEVSDSLNPSGGFFNRIGGMVTAFFSAIPNMIIDVIGFVFGDNIGKRLQNGFDSFVAMVNGAVRSVFAKIFEGWSYIFEAILPKDSGLVKMLKGWGESAEKAADENWKTMDTLMSDQSQTLSKISKSNKDAAEKDAKSTEQSTAKAVAAQSKFNDVMSAAAVNRTDLIRDAQSFVGQPQVQVPAQVAPAPVNKPETPDSDAKKEVKAAIDANPELLNVMQAMLQVLKDQLAVGTRQADNSERLLSIARPGTSFASAEDVANRIFLNRG